MSYQNLSEQDKAICEALQGIVTDMGVTTDQIASLLPVVVEAMSGGDEGEGSAPVEAETPTTPEGEEGAEAKTPAEDETEEAPAEETAEATA